MDTLNSFKNANSLSDIAQLLSFTPKGLSYVLYKLAPEQKYRSFDIPKKNGGCRTIQSPEPRLARLQNNLAKRLNECANELALENRKFWHASHGFRRRRTIVSNAEVHKRRRFVFNVDIENFFGSINFGRVRGFFIHDRNFALTPQASTIIAQIACHENCLPQGSPCSPVISNFIGNLIDLRMIALARRAHCNYSRYVDDLTFSTNEKLFPETVAIKIDGGNWMPSHKLVGEIKRAGFELNEKKTRMSFRNSRQSVTGLVVNAKPNIEQSYYRCVRAMCHELFKRGRYYHPTGNTSDTTENLDPLEGMLAHIHFVKMRGDRKFEVNKFAQKAGEFNPPHAPKELYQRFLFYKHFVAPTAPMIVTEGATDIIYLKCAIRALAESFPQLASGATDKSGPAIKYLKPSYTTTSVLNLGQGTGGQTSLVSQYAKTSNRYPHRPMHYPVIVLCDNDKGVKKTLFNAANKKTSAAITVESKEPFYYLGQNLYLVKIPEGEPAKEREIEHLFPKSVLDTEIDGKFFDLKKDHGDEKAYGKFIFAERVVRPNWREIDFGEFSDLLSRIEECLKHYGSIIDKA